MSHRSKRRKTEGAEAEVEAEAEMPSSVDSVAAAPSWTHTARELLALQEKHTFPPRAQCSNALFDCSGAFVLFSTLTGVKVCVFIYRYILNEFCSRF